jgi:hypothetical protein
LYKEWLRKAKLAGFNVVWLPLRKEFRDKYNETKAYEFFKTIEGVNYGFPVLLTGWLDTLKGNMPCVPPEYTTCLDPELLDILFTNVERLSHAAGVVWR